MKRHTNEELKQIRVGEVSYTKYGTPTIILEYHSSKTILVEFQDEYKYQYCTTYPNFIKRQLTNPYDKRIANIGYIGTGKYNFKEHTQAYKKWASIIARCNLDDAKNVDSSIASYIDCEISEEWQCFQNFAAWYESHKYEVPNEYLSIDKDIMIHGNKMYCKEKCLLVPETINSLFIKSKSKRGNLPIGVMQPLGKNYYIAKISKYNRTYRIGSYSSPIDAFYAYKTEKEKYIKEIAEKYKSIIPKYIYDLLYQYEVMITD